jgi:hypothetical protein
MTFGTKIRTYDGAHATHDNGSVNCGVDWGRGKVWIGGTNGGVNYLTRYGITSGIEETFAASSSIQSGMGFGSVGLDSDSDLYGSGPNVLTHGGVTKIDGASLTAVASWLYGSADFGGSNTVTLKIGGTQYILDTNIGNTIINENNTSLSGGTAYIASFGWPNGNARSCICAGKAGTNYSYLLTSPGDGISTQICNLQKINMPAGTASLIATIVPTDIDASYTELYFDGLCLDQTDGHLIAACVGVGGSNKNYIIKLHNTTGAIIWSRLLPTTSRDTIGGAQWSQSRITNSQLAVLTSTPARAITVIDTTDGSIISTQTAGLAGLTFWGQQAYDSNSGAIIGMFDLNSAAGGPALLGSSTYGFRGWGALYVTAHVGPNPGNGNRRWVAAIRSVKAAA